MGSVQAPGYKRSSPTMVAAADRISNACGRVQAMPPLRRALLAREALIASAGKAVSFGPREARLRTILAWTGRGGMVTSSLILLASRYLAGRKAAQDHKLPHAIFVGIGALREYQLRKSVTTQLGQTPQFIDQRTPDGLGVLTAPGPRRIMSQWIRITREALSILSETDPDFAKMDLLSTLTMRIHELAYLLALFENLYETHPETRVYCSTADIPAHAACLAGFRVEYWQHGFLARTLVFPRFSAMVALTAYEGRYVADRVPGLALSLGAPCTERAPVTETFAFAGDYQAPDPVPVTTIANLALARGFRVVVRPHPNGFDELWSGIRGQEGVVFDTEGRFEDFLEKWRPAFLVSWFSTTLLDGLRAGAVPITLARSTDLLVLPIEEIALSWPEDAPQIETCMRDASERHKVHNRINNAL